MAQPIDIVACRVGPFEFVAEVSAHVCGSVNVSDGITDLVGYLYSIV